MSPFQVIRRQRPVLLSARFLRGVESAFWFVLAMALSLGGKDAAAGLPALQTLISFGTIAEAQAKSEPVQAGTVTLAVSGFVASEYPPTVLYPVAIQEIPDWLNGAAPSPSYPAAPVSPAAVGGREPAIAIVIDDLGPDPGRTRRAMGLPKEIALSFLPYAVATPDLAREAANRGHDVMAHVPMQAEADADPGEMALMLGQPADEVVRRLDWNLARVPGFVGINNHMGSLFTETRDAMVPVMRALEDRHLFFFDSLTSPRSQGVKVARSFGVASASRDIFLDDTQTPEEVNRELALLERIARTQGVAVAIGHPHDVTLSILERWCKNLKGVRLVRIRDAIRMKTERENGVPVAELSGSP
jgi:uncharacterized protein